MTLVDDTGISRRLHGLECFQLFHYDTFMALSDVSVLSPPKNQLEKKRKRLAGLT